MVARILRFFLLFSFLFFLGCGRSAVLGQGSLADEAIGANLQDDKDEILDSYDNPVIPDPDDSINFPKTPTPSPGPGGGLSGNLGKLAELFKRAKGGTTSGSSGGAGGMKNNLLSAFCKLGSLRQQMQPSSQYPEQRGFKKMGGLLQKMQQKIGGLMKMGGQSGGMGSGGMTGGSGGMQQIMQKLSQVCQTASTSGGLSASGLLNGISLTGSSSQQSNYVNDLGAATNIINGQLF